ncbi:MAG: RdgB/HAM1 family non-canonical purine NTP pyrophosphatase [Anaerolineaceae bacterium]|nr:RdgB/HAM1 family non-canonical purine NTP pyrophosphatase [Anaerolineaceae bacterium]
MKILIATNNKGKKAEISALFEGFPFELCFPTDLGIDTDVDETGSTYAENAALKAETLCQLSGLVTLADDTGLEVAALDGRPGLHSKRYVPTAGATDADRRAKLLVELTDKPTPWLARFVCSVAVAAPGMPTQYFDGEVQGEIITRESGEYGFGYDRLFWIPQVGRTLEDLPMLEKNQISHRAVAVNKAIQYLIKD